MNGTLKVNFHFLKPCQELNVEHQLIGRDLHQPRNLLIHINSDVFFLIVKSSMNITSMLSQLTFTCSKSTKDTLKKCVKYSQS